MVTKYLDHAAYAVDANFVGTWGGYTDKLTINSISSGVLAPGARVQAPAVTSAQFARIADGYRGFLDYGTSTGGVGTMQMNSGTGGDSYSNMQMTARGGFPRNPITWGVPLEGDGLARDKSTAAATLSIDLSGATAAAGNTFIVAGAVLTCVASGAGANQFNAGSGATLAAALRDAINRTSNTATVNAADTGWYNHKIQDALYARVDPANTSSLQIMTRAGSATYNNNTSFNATYSGITGIANTSYNFTGGISGCWGVAINYVSMWPSLWGNGSYGVFLNSNCMLAGTRAAGDYINVRGHSRVNGVTAFAVNSFNCDLNPQEGTLANPLVFDFDNGTVWPEDGTNARFIFLQIGGYYSTWNWGNFNNNGANSGVHWKGRRNASNQRTARFEVVFGANALNFAQITSGSFCIFDNTELVGVDSQSRVQIKPSQGAGFYKTLMRGCRVGMVKQGFNFIDASAASYYTTQLEAYDLTFELTGADAASSSVVNLSATQDGTSFRFYCDGLNLLGFVAGSTFAATGQYPRNICTSVIKNVNPGNVLNYGGAFLSQDPRNSMAVWGDYGIFISSALGKGMMVSDTALGSVSWVPTQNQPCLNARLRDGVSAWSLKVAPSTYSGGLTAYNPLVVNGGPATMNTASKKQITVNFLAEKTLNITQRDVAVIATYVDSTGTFKEVDSVIVTGSTALGTANNTWIRSDGSSAMATDPADGVSRASFTDANGTRYYNQYAITLTTPTIVPANSDINWQFRVNTPAGTVIQQYMLDPMLSIVDVS